MSLEEKIGAHTAAVEALTDAVQHLASVLRTAQATPPKAETVKEAAAPAPKPAATPKIAKAAPPAPLAKASTAGSRATAPVADAGSDPLDLGDEEGEAEGTVADLQELVPQVAEKHGRAVALALFSSLGYPSGGKDLVAKAPEQIPAAVKLFRAKLAEAAKG